MSQALEGIEPPAPIRVAHFGQFHYRPGVEKSPDALRIISQSQSELWNRIQARTKKGEQTVVFGEGLAEDFGPQDRQYHPGFEQITKEFPQGPVAPADMNAKQRDLMILHGAAEVLYVLGQLDSLYGTEDEALNRRANEFVGTNHLVRDSKEHREKVLVSREIEALQRIAAKMHADPQMRAAVESGKTELLLIYGQGHNFGRFASPHFEIKRYGEIQP